MVLELLVKPWKAESKPLNMILYGALYASVAIILSLWIFKDQSSMIMVFLTVLACMPLIHRAIIQEEKRELQLKQETRILKSHSKILKFLLFLFIGFVIAFSLWFIFLPSSTVDILFRTQMHTIAAINNQVTAGAYSTGFLSAILANNMKVLFFSLFFAFFYGAGAIFILAWNASVIASAIGTFVRNNIELYAQSIGLMKAAGYMHIFSLGMMRYMTHGIFEILAYFIGALAGMLISVAIVRHDMGTEKFRIIMKDVLILIAIAVLMLLLAGIIEVYVTPSII